MDPVLLSIARDGERVALLAVGGHANGAPVPPRAIIGQASMPSGAPLWSTFRPGGAFLAFYVSFMRGEQPVKPEILSAAHVRPGEKVYVIDARTAERDDKLREDDVPWTDIIGWYDSDAAGRPIAASFAYNAEHPLVLPDGRMSSLIYDDRLAQALVAF